MRMHLTEMECVDKWSRQMLNRWKESIGIKAPWKIAVVQTGSWDHRTGYTYRIYEATDLDNLDNLVEELYRLYGLNENQGMRIERRNMKTQENQPYAVWAYKMNGKIWYKIVY